MSRRWRCFNFLDNEKSRTKAKGHSRSIAKGNAAKQRSEAKKNELNAKILKSYQDAADRKEAYGYLRLGQCYRDGEHGLEKDLSKAKKYLKLAADAGSATAATELSRLP